MKNNNQEQIAFYTDKSVKLRAILAIHSTTLGPAVGGIRIASYKTVKDALQELIGLSQTMTLKAAAGGLNFGGGHIVVVEQEGMEKDEPFFRALGRFVESFKGRFIAGEDVGIPDDAMEYMAMETHHLTGLPSSDTSGISHPQMCAYGTGMGILAAALYRWGAHDISGKKVVVQGFGRVGAELAHWLKNEQHAHVLVSDTDPGREKLAEQKGFETISPENTLIEKCDVLAPCAVGPVITPETAPLLQCEIVAGSANNQLLNDSDERLLNKRDILYAPDFIINAGAIISISEAFSGYNETKIRRKTERIFDRLLDILEFAGKNNISVQQAALDYARKRIEAIKSIKGHSTAKENAVEVGRRALDIKH